MEIYATPAYTQKIWTKQVTILGDCYNCPRIIGSQKWFTWGTRPYGSLISEGAKKLCKKDRPEDFYFRFVPNQSLLKTTYMNHNLIPSADYVYSANGCVRTSANFELPQECFFLTQKGLATPSTNFQRLLYHMIRGKDYRLGVSRWESLTDPTEAVIGDVLVGGSPWHYYRCIQGFFGTGSGDSRRPPNSDYWEKVTQEAANIHENFGSVCDLSYVQGEDNVLGKNIYGIIMRRNYQPTSDLTANVNPGSTYAYVTYNYRPTNGAATFPVLYNSDKTIWLQAYLSDIGE